MTPIIPVSASNFPVPEYGSFLANANGTAKPDTALPVSICGSEGTRRILVAAGNIENSGNRFFDIRCKRRLLIDII